MKNKLLLKVYLPASGELLEMKVSKKLTVKNVLDLLVDYLKGKSEGEFIPTDNTILCYRGNGMELDPSAYIGCLDENLGTNLILI